MTARKYTDTATLMSFTDKTESDHTAVFDFIITAVSEWIDRACNREYDGFQADALASPRVYAGSGQTVQSIEECVEITEVAVKQAAPDLTYKVWTPDQWFPFTGEGKLPILNHTPYTGIMTAAGNGLLFTEARYGNTMRGFNDYRWSPTAFRRVPTVQVTARWGYSDDAPFVVQQACIVESLRIYKRGLSFYGNALASAALGQLIITESIDPATVMMLDKAGMRRPAI